jgi:hypothetical protein
MDDPDEDTVHIVELATNESCFLYRGIRNRGVGVHVRMLWRRFVRRYDSQAPRTWRLAKPGSFSAPARP